MNFTARIKQDTFGSNNTKIDPKYVLNLTIDIPLNSKYIIKNKNISVSNQPSLKNKQQFQLTLTPATNNKYHHIPSSFRTHRPTISIINSKPSSRTRYKSDDIIVKKNKKTIKPYKKLIQNISILDQIQNNDNDTVIKYTNQSSQDTTNKNIPSLNIPTNPSQYPIQTLSQIRQFQRQAIYKKQYLNYLYLKQKFLIIASVKKIQRAWRNYQTKKLIKSYSYEQKLSYKKSIQIQPSYSAKNFFGKKKLKNQIIENQSIIEQLESNNLRNNKNQYRYRPIKNKIDHKFNKNKNKSQKLLQFKQTQIHQWPNQLKLSNKLQPKQILLSNKYIQQKSPQLISSQSQQNQFRKQKIQFFQNQIRKIDNQISYVSSSSNYSQSPDKNYLIQQLQNQKLRKKLQIFNQMRLQQKNNDQQSINEDQSPTLQRTKPKFIQSIKNNDIQYSSQQQSSQLVNSIDLQPQIYKLSERLQKLPIMHQLQLCKLIIESILQQSCKDILQSDVQFKIFTSIFINKKCKAQGICTNLQSIKDYLENLVSYLLDKQLNIIEHNLDISCGPTPYVLFQYLRKNQIIDNQGNSLIINIDLFEKHWIIASQQIYFDRKYQDDKVQIQRIRYLKGLTKIYFRAIFDAFNQCLQYHRVYGILGKPYPWKKSIKINSKATEIKNAMKSSYKRISEMAKIYCGLFFQDKSQSIPIQIVKQVQEERINRLLQYDLTQQQIKWNFYDDQEAQVLYQLTCMLEQDILSEVLLDIQRLKNL